MPWAWIAEAEACGCTWLPVCVPADQLAPLGCRRAAAQHACTPSSRAPGSSACPLNPALAASPASLESTPVMTPPAGSVQIALRAWHPPAFRRRRPARRPLPAALPATAAAAALPHRSLGGNRRAGGGGRAAGPAARAEPCLGCALWLVRPRGLGSSRECVHDAGWCCTGALEPVERVRLPSCQPDCHAHSLALQPAAWAAWAAWGRWARCLPWNGRRCSPTR